MQPSGVWFLLYLGLENRVGIFIETLSFQAKIANFWDRNTDTQYWVWWPREAASKGFQRFMSYYEVENWDGAFNLTASYRRQGVSWKRCLQYHISLLNTLFQEILMWLDIGWLKIKLFQWPDSLHQGKLSQEWFLNFFSFYLQSNLNEGQNVIKNLVRILITNVGDQ